MTPIGKKWPYLLALALPCAAVVALGAGACLRERDLARREALERRARAAEDVGRAIAAQLDGIVRAEAAAHGPAAYADAATVLVARLVNGVAVPRRPAGCPGHEHELPARCDERARAERIARDPTLLAQVRGAFGIPRTVLDAEGSLLATARLAGDGAPLLVVVRLGALLAGSGIVPGDTMRVVAAPAGEIPLGGGMHDLALAWTLPPAIPLLPGRAPLILGTMAIALLATVLGAALLARNVARELRLTRLRQGFVASVSHELRTPLTGIRLLAETLRERPVSAVMRDEYLETIVGECDRLGRLVQNVLDFSSVEEGRRRYRVEEVVLADAVERALAALRQPLEQQGFTVRLRIEDDLPPLLLDRDAIVQVILNLLSNAMKYSAEAREIDVAVRRSGDTAVVSVRDYGVGIAPADRARVFDRFYRAPGTSPHVTGAGLGLTIAQHAAVAHGGRLSVESAPGQGSTFHLHLPLRTA